MLNYSLINTFKIHLIITLLINIHFSSQSQNCKNLNSEFSSYESALKKIKSTNFVLIDSCDTSKSSWILKTEFYSCDKKYGYLLLSTRKKTYIHNKVPIDIWIRYKETESFGRFYNKKIKEKYKLII